MQNLQDQPDPARVFDAIAADEKARITVARLARLVGIADDDILGHRGLRLALENLESMGRIHRWANLRGKPMVTLTSLAAYRLGLRLNGPSTKWVPLGKPMEVSRLKREVLDGGEQVICETDLIEVPPGTMNRIVDEKTGVDEDPGIKLRSVLAEEKRLGLVRPTLPIVGCVPWTARNADRPGCHVVDPADDPRRHASNAPLPTPEPRKRGRPRKVPAESAGPCEVCGGRPLRALVSLVPVRVGRNRAARPPAIRDGGEYCCRCSRSFQDAAWPKVNRLPSDSESKAKQV